MSVQQFRLAYMLLPIFIFLSGFSFIYAQFNYYRIPQKISYTQPLQEVFLSDLVYPQESGEVQLTLIPQILEEPLHNLFQVSAAFEVGITNRWQVGVEWDAYQQMNSKIIGIQKIGTQQTGTGNISLGSKYAFMNLFNTHFHSAFTFEVEIPSGNQSIGLNEASSVLVPGIILARDFPIFNNTHIFLNAFYSYSTEETGLTFNSGIFLPLGNFRLVSEFSLEKTEDGEISHFAPGIVCDLPGTWEFSVGFPIKTGKDLRNDYQVVSLLIYEFDL